MTKSLRILIVDDHPRTRQGIRALLASKFSRAELYEAANGIEAIERANELDPDIVLMDVRMPIMDGIEATRAIKLTSPELKIIVLSTEDDWRSLACAAGADAFITKNKPQRLLEVLAEVSPSCEESE